MIKTKYNTYYTRKESLQIPEFYEQDKNKLFLEKRCAWDPDELAKLGLSLDDLEEFDEEEGIIEQQ